MYRAFIEMITVLDDNLDEENLNITRLIYSEFVSSKDPGLAGMCLEALRDSLYLKYRPETSMLLMYDYKELASYKNFDIILMIIDTWGEFKDTGVVSTLKENLTGGNYEIAIHSAKALEKITGIKYNVSLKPQGDINWARLDAAYTGRFATLRTSIGDIKIKMFPEIAPLTVLNFLKLSEQKLINNTMFPRVVPNFVIQGGDPSESGWGSAGYIIRSEFTDLPYERGSVGMASDGKDTEGSQFFITHSPQPHLEGRYTVFGIVIEGFDVLDNIKYGDSVEEIVLSTE
jgi:cyclophilin family peptidyl-prolyl cis-trans isomerase